MGKCYSLNGAILTLSFPFLRVKNTTSLPPSALISLSSGDLYGKPRIARKPREALSSMNISSRETARCSWRVHPALSQTRWRAGGHCTHPSFDQYCDTLQLFRGFYVRSSFRGVPRLLLLRLGDRLGRPAALEPTVSWKIQEDLDECNWCRQPGPCRRRIPLQFSPSIRALEFRNSW